VPHLGADEFDVYARLLERFDNLWLDTTMMLSDYFPGLSVPPLSRFRTDRVMYGTDFCNLPYAWDRELVRIARMGLPEEHLDLLLRGNARDFFSLPNRGE
jgi:predicted TIM-barrel fold metal-dependent hydrolase